MPESLRAAGSGGFADLLDTMTRGMNVARTDARLRVSGPDRYRLDYYSPRPGRGADDDRLRRRAPLAGLPGPDRGRPGRSADGPYRVPGRLVLAAPRPAVRRHGTHLPWPSRPPAPRDPRTRRRRPGRGASAVPRHHRRRDRGRRDRLPAPPDLLRRRHARDLVGAGRHQHRSRRPGRVPGARPARHPHRGGNGNWVADEIAVMPGLAGTAARAAAATVHRTAGAVSAARSFLDDLRGRR